MKESYTEGPASHGDSESCTDARKDVGEALTGAHTGRVLSRENRCDQDADAVELSGRQHARARQGECAGGPARSETSGTGGNSMRENREIPQPPTGTDPEGRAGKAKSHKSAMNGCGKSDNSIVLTKPPNKVEQAMAEVVEGRELTKENADQQNTPRTQGRTKKRVKCAGTCATGCSQEQGRAIQRALPPPHNRTARSSVPENQTGRSAGRRRSDVGAIRRKPQPES